MNRPLAAALSGNAPPAPPLVVTTLPGMTRIACLQLAPRLGDLAYNRALIAEAVSETDADIVVLPELITSGYVFASREEALAAAVSADELDWRFGPIVVGGFCERGEDGEVYNSAAIADASGVVSVYRKTHLWDNERNLFAPGDARPPVIETEHGRLGVLVCYDLEFMEMPRALALRGADLICAPVNWPRRTTPPEGERPAEQGTVQAIARTNRVFVAIADRAGVERGVEWVGGTCLIDPDGWLVEGEVDLTRARDKRLSEYSDVLADRRPELYEDLQA